MVGEPTAVVRPSIRVGTVDSLLRAFVVSLIGTAPLAPVVQQTVIAAILPVAIPSTILTAVVLFVVAITLEAGRATIRRFATVYRIYDERIEVEQGLYNPRTTVLPRSAIDRVTLSAGILKRQVGGGDIRVSVGAKHTKYDVTLRDVRDANTWYQRLRPVADGTPLETFGRSIGPSLLSMFAYLTLGIGLGSIVAMLAGGSAGGGITLNAVLLGAVLITYGVSTVYFFYVASIEYRIYEDHIERNRLFFGSDRTYIVAGHIDSVEHVRTVTEKLFDVGTVSIRVERQDRPFRLRAIGDSEEVYERLRMTA